MDPNGRFQETGAARPLLFLAPSSVNCLITNTGCVFISRLRHRWIQNADVRWLRLTSRSASCLRETEEGSRGGRDVGGFRYERGESPRNQSVCVKHPQRHL